MQRHHLLPRQLLTMACFSPLIETIGQEQIGFDDFRANGLLLPSRSHAARQTGLPLHRGPHRNYNSLVAERMGQIEAGWVADKARRPAHAIENALLRLRLLQRALRRRLIVPGRARLRLSRFDPLGVGRDFSELDAMADALWAVTAEANIPADPGIGL